MPKHETTIVLRIVQGEDYTAELAWVTDQNTPMHIGAPASMEIRNAANEVVLALKDVAHIKPGPAFPIKDRADGLLRLSTTSGIIQLVIMGQQTRDVVPGNYNFDMFCRVHIDSNLIKTGTQVRRVIRGQAIVVDNITQALP